MLVRRVSYSSIRRSLKDDFNTTLPLVKIVLDPVIKLNHDFDEDKKNIKETCCLERPPVISDVLSLYHFFRSVRVRSETKIHVKVCGVKNLVVQNDENVMDVNSAVYPFGTRPDVPDFDVLNTGILYVITQQMVSDAVIDGLSDKGKSSLEKHLGEKLNNPRFEKLC